MPGLRIGTSGWSYNEWAGVFYPSKSTNKLSFYSKIYDTAEVDSTFYAFPTKGLTLGWAKYTPEDFIFSLKLPQELTHDKKLNLEKGVHGDVLRFLNLLRPLMEGGKLGPILIQLPPSFSYDRDFKTLQGFLDAVPNDIRWAVEFRHPSWLREDVWEALRGRNVANTIVDEPLLPPVTVTTADFGYVRWHGRGNRPWYNYRYSQSELKTWIPKVKEITARTKETFGYFNNHFHGFAVENSLKMMGMLGVSTPKQDEAGEQASRFLATGKAPKGEGSMLDFMGKEEKP